MNLFRYFFVPKIFFSYWFANLHSMSHLSVCLCSSLGNLVSSDICLCIIILNILFTVVYSGKSVFCLSLCMLTNIASTVSLVIFSLSQTNYHNLLLSDFIYIGFFANLNPKYKFKSLTFMMCMPFS